MHTYLDENTTAQEKYSYYIYYIVVNIININSLK